MPGARLPMRKIRDILRLRADGLSKRKVAASLSIGVTTAGEVIRRANQRYFERYRDAAELMGVIEQVSRYDEHVSAARFSTMKHFAERAERSIRRLQKEGLADKKVDPRIAADALGAMVARFAEIWMVQGYRDYEFDDAVAQLTRLWANALGLPDA